MSPRSIPWRGTSGRWRPTCSLPGGRSARGYIAKRYPGTVRNPNYTFNEMIFLQKTAHLREVQKAYDLADEGDKLLKEKRYGEALAKYQAAGAREPAQAPFPSSIGRVHLIRKENADAEDALRRGGARSFASRTCCSVR